MNRKHFKISLILLCGALSITNLSGCGAVAKLAAAHAAARSGKQDEADIDNKKEDPGKEEAGKASKRKTKKTGLKDKENSDDTEISEDIYKEDASEVFAEMSDWVFMFSSGAGGWGTEMYVNPDGSFSGRYHDSDMGDTGPDYPNGIMYECSFSGRFSDNVRSAGPLMHSLSIESIEYENEPDTEEIKDGILYKYTTPYGLEELDRQSGYDAPFVFMEAGAVTSALNEEEMSWVAPMHFGAYVGADWDYIEDKPEELPYAVLVNSLDQYAFYTENISEKNKVFLVNKVKLPGLTNTILDIYDDGTYYCVDDNADKSFRVISTCFETSKDADPTNNAPDLVNDALNVIYGRSAPSFDDVYVTAPYDAYEMLYSKMAVNGYHSDYAFWHPGDDDKTSCIGRFLVQSGYDTDKAYVYAYIIETKNNSKKYPDGGFANSYIDSLTLTGRRDRLSSEGEGKGAVRSMLTNMQTPEGNYVKAMETLWVSEADTDLIKQYHLENADFADDYELVYPDDTYHEYKLAYGDETPFYVQFPRENFRTLYHAYELEDYYGGPASEDTTRLVELYLNDKDEIVYGYEVYTP